MPGKTMRQWIRENRLEFVMVFSAGILMTNCSHLITGIIQERLVIAPDVFTANMIVFGSLFLMAWLERRKKGKPDAR